MSKLKTQALDQLTTAFGLDPGMQEAARTALEDASEEEIKADLETLQHLKVRSHQLAQRAREKRLAPEPSTFSVWMRTVVLPDLATIGTRVSGSRPGQIIDTTVAVTPPAADGGRDLVVNFADQLITPPSVFTSRPAGRLDWNESVRALANLEVFCRHVEVPDCVVGVGAEGGQVGRFLIDRLKWRHLELIAWDPQTSGPDLKRSLAARGRVLIVNGVVETPAMFRPVRQLIEKEYVGVKIGCTALAANSAVFAGVTAVDLYSPIVTTTSGKIELPWAKGGRYEHSGDRYMFGDAGGSMTVFGEQMDEIVRGIADETPKV